MARNWFNCLVCLSAYSQSWHEDMGYDENKDGLCPACWSDTQAREEDK